MRLLRYDVEPQLFLTHEAVKVEATGVQLKIANCGCTYGLRFGTSRLCFQTNSTQAQATL